MYYKLRTVYNEKGVEVLLKRKYNNKYVYEIQDYKGIVYKVDKDWLLFHKDAIVNLGVKADKRFYVKNKPELVIWDYWCYYKGEKEQGKMTISKVLKEYDLEDLNGLKQKGYDGIVIRNAPIGIKDKKIIQKEIVVFKPSQIKAVYNWKPKKTDSISDGYSPSSKKIKLLTQEQLDYFKKTKILDDYGGLEVCYHSTNETFDSFDLSHVGEGGGNSYGNGFYFSSEPIEEYGKVMEVFLDVRKPYIIENINDFDDVLHFLLLCFNMVANKGDDVIRIPKEIKGYLKDESSVPLVEIKGTKWYSITQREKELLIKFVADIDKIPEAIWRQWPEDKMLQYSHWGNLADRIVRNCVIRDK